MEPFLNSGSAFLPQIAKVGGIFCPHSGNIAKIQFRFTIHTNRNFTVYQIFYLQLYFRFISRLALIFPKNPERYMANTINTPKSNPSPALATLS